MEFLLGRLLEALAKKHLSAISDPWESLLVALLILNDLRLPF